MPWPPVEPLEAARVRLEPLSEAHATQMLAVLSDVELYEFIGGGPPTIEQLRFRYAAQAAGQSPDGSQWWLNWIVRLRQTGRAVGYVQATAQWRADDLVADIAWVVGTADRGQGIASEAAGTMVGWLRHAGVSRLRAHIRPGHLASEGVARNLGMRQTDVVQDGEVRWVLRLGESPG